MKQLQRLFRTLGNHRRIRILQLLLARKELSVGTIASALELSLTATSRHLSALKNLELLETRQERLTVYYRINSDMPKDARSILHLIRTN